MASSMAKLVRYLMLALSYLCCLIRFNNRVKEFRAREKSLILAKEQLLKNIDDAEDLKHDLEEDDNRCLEEDEKYEDTEALDPDLEGDVNQWLPDLEEDVNAKLEDAEAELKPDFEEDVNGWLEDAKLEDAEADLKPDFEQDVNRWLEDAKDVREAVLTLERNVQDCMRRSISFLNWSRIYNLSKEIEDQKSKITDLVQKIEDQESKLTNLAQKIKEAQDRKITYLMQKSHLDRVLLQAAALWENLPSRDIMPSESLRSAWIEIVKAMADDSDSMIVVFGQKGAGKTILVEQAERLAEEPPLQFKVVRIAPSQIKIAQTEEDRAEELRNRLKTEQRILIIIEDIGESLSLEAVGIPNQIGCKVLLTTSEKSVSSSFTIGSSKVITLGPLHRNEALKLLEKNLSPHINSSDPINNMALQVAKECKQSPIAIIILGRALRGQDVNQWRNAYQNLKSNREDGESEGVRLAHRSVSWSYDHLKYKEAKICFLLCSLFPRGHAIARQDLVKFVWGLGTYQGVGSIAKVREEVNEVVDYLIDSFLLVKHGKEHCRMQNVVRDAAVGIASTDGSLILIKPVADLGERQMDEDLDSYEAISSVANKPEAVHEENFHSKRLQIHHLGGDSCKKIPNEFMQMLKALSGLTIHQGLLSLDSLQKLNELRVLNLMHCKLDGLSSLGKLTKLEILSFQGSDIRELPDEIGDLNNLRLLDLFDCQLQKISLRLIVRLTQLEELYFSGLSFEEWWSTEKSAERRNIAPSNSMIISPATSVTESFKYLNTIDAMFETPTSIALRVSVFSQNQSKKPNPTVKYLNRDHILCYRNHVVPNLVQTMKKLTVKSCDKVHAIFQDGFILHGVLREKSTELLSELTYLKLEDLRQLSWIWCRQTNHVSLQNLRTVELKDCHKLKSLFSLSLAQSLSQLETLEIHGCNELKQIIADLDVDGDETMHPVPLQPQLLPILKTLRITRCGELEYIFQVITGQILQNLELLEIGSCSKLQQVFSFKDAGDGKDIEKPAPKELSRRASINLRNLRPENVPSITLPSLQKFVVGACHQLSNAAMFEVVKHCDQLQSLWLFQVRNEFFERFMLHDGFFLSSLNELKLEKINELNVLWKEPTQIVTLQNLTHLEVVNCNKLKNLFSSPLIARNLLQLSHLEIKGCNALEQIIVRDRYSSSSTSCSLKPVFFRNLRHILVENCKELKTIFPVSIAQRPKLTTVRIVSAPNLTHIFRHESEAKVKSEKALKLRFPDLEVLHLEKLQNLVNLVPKDYLCEFPVLNSLVRKECDHLDTVFIKVDSEPTVYATTKENLLPEKDPNYITLRRSVTFQEISTRNGDINWSAENKFDWKRLPKQSAANR